MPLPPDPAAVELVELVVVFLLVVDVEEVVVVVVVVPGAKPPLAPEGHSQPPKADVTELGQAICS